ncbi:MAG: hypothetical protein ACYC6Y_04950 [Thermoguttaceae bacterium]
MEAVRGAMFDALEEDNPMTVRQVYYRLVSLGIIDKTEAQYQTVCRLLAEMRRAGDLPFDWLADATRWQRKPTTHSSLKSMLRRSARMYRQALWDDQDVYVEIWLEKDALAGVLYDVTAEWDVPLMVTRGYPSLSYLYSAAEALQEEEKPCYLYYFGDHDPSGVDIPRKVEADLREFAPGAEIHFERVAVLPRQITEWNLQTRPTKKSDTRAKNFEGESVEVDAIPPTELRRLVRGCIERHIDPEALERTLAVEEAERDTLQAILENLEAGR